MVLQGRGTIGRANVQGSNPITASDYGAGNPECTHASKSSSVSRANAHNDSLPSFEGAQSGKVVLGRRRGCTKVVPWRPYITERPQRGFENPF